MSDLLVHPAAPASDGTILSVTPASAGWEYVGFEVLTLADQATAARSTRDRELCVVVISGTVNVLSPHGEWGDLGGRADPWSGPPDAAYLPPETAVEIEAAGGAAEVALCWAPAPRGGVVARLLPGAQTEIETRGHGALERHVCPILMGDGQAESLLVCEVITPAGHWSSYPPRSMTATILRVRPCSRRRTITVSPPARGFGLQRVYTDDRSLDESVAFGDRDCVLVPRGYNHPHPGVRVVLPQCHGWANTAVGGEQRSGPRVDPDPAGHAELRPGASDVSYRYPCP